MVYTAESLIYFRLGIVYNCTFVVPFLSKESLFAKSALQYLAHVLLSPRPFCPLQNYFFLSKTEELGDHEPNTWLGHVLCRWMSNYSCVRLVSHHMPLGQFK